MTESLTVRLRATRGQDGFALVEAIVALVVAAIVFTALAYAAIGAIRASMTSRQAQQAVDIATQRLEQLRQFSYAGLGHILSDLSGDAAVTTCGSNKCFNAGTGPEKLVLLASGAVNPHITTLSGTATNNTTYTLSAYVTAPVDSYSASYKRVTVVVSWSVGSNTFTKKVSTLVTYTQRGLPLPVFKLTLFTTSPVTINKGADASFLFKLGNQGAPDRWDLSYTGTDTWQFFEDDGDGLWDSTQDTNQLADSNGNGIPDTGMVEPAGAIAFWAVRTTSSTTVVGTYPVTFTATSGSQPLVPSGTSSVPVSVVVTAAPPPPPPPATGTCAASPTVPGATASSGYTITQYILHNRSANNPSWPPLTGNPPPTTTTGQGVPLTAATDAVQFPTATDPWIYSSDISPTTTPGRILLTSGSSQLTGSDPTRVVDWRESTSGRDQSGTAVVRFWYAPVAGYPLTTVNLPVQLYSIRNGSVTGLGSAAVTGTYSCPGSGWQEAWVNIPISVTANPRSGRQIGVRIWNNGTAPVRLGYDTASQPAMMTLPEK